MFQLAYFIIYNEKNPHYFTEPLSLLGQYRAQFHRAT